MATRTLYANSMGTSPYVLSCFVTMRVKKLAFESVPVALEAYANLAPEFRSTSLTTRIPVLVDGDFKLAESQAIVEYLEDRYGAPEHARVLPEDVYKRAVARQVMAWVRSDLLPIREERSTEYVFYPHETLPPLAPLSPRAEKAVARLLDAATELVPADSGHLFGEWSIADVDLAMMLQRLVKTGYPLPAKLATSANREWEHPAVQEFVRQERPPYKGY